MKRVVTRLWDSLSLRERANVANDGALEGEMAKWFSATVALETKAKYESPSYWLNDPDSFRYGQIMPPSGWPA